MNFLSREEKEKSDNILSTFEKRKVSFFAQLREEKERIEEDEENSLTLRAE